MTYTSKIGIPYSTDQNNSRQELDLYFPSHSSASSPLLVYIHGGAWRSESKSDFRSSLVPSLLQTTGFPLALLEYRLAPGHLHPTQMIDILAGLLVLTNPALLPQEEFHQRWDRENIYLIGHSAGAFMALTTVQVPPTGVTPSFTVPESIRSSIKGIIAVDGIYDLPDLLKEYPTYHYFVDDAFGKDEVVLANESPSNWSFPPGAIPRILVLHSREDELLSLRQPTLYAAQMAKLKDSGMAVEVEVDFATLKGGHEACVRSPELAQAVARWVNKN
ncbi:alpha/beta-hydrolase [Meredithblackwellia eburnea MCA 4105]